ncbi:twin transmembrane helix small protein [Caulobacter segnis]|uniref:twin transmembrane helix small protein n=1 Tax=Caulobacter segnis TaxID=88688 RepID=UPI00241019B5|nr:twin transmembrane helix small protein [Caulobacter segnis]MDG2519958.1 twin transmembrane helix small protein [Caulobacter segnis]
MDTLFLILVPIALLSVLGVLGIGLYTLARGGAGSSARSNKLMQLRVVLQAVAVGVVLAAVWIKSR